MIIREQDTEFLPGPKVRQRYGGVSEMTLWRWIKHPDMDFPKPVYFGRLRYWRISELESWERAQAAKGPAQQSGIAASSNTGAHNVDAT